MTEGLEDALRREAVRVYRRYQTEIVEDLNLCPWAERARKDGRVREEVLLGRVPDVESTLSALATLADDPATEIGLLLFPRIKTSATSFDRFVSEVSRRDAERRPLGAAPFALAAFHPRAAADLTDPERLIPFLRRSPDPTIQLVRLESLDRVREGFNEGTAFVDLSVFLTHATAEDTLGLRERIARANDKTVRRVGVAEVERRLAAIAADRDAAYARLSA